MQAAPRSPRSNGSRQLARLAGLVFLSGAASLVYEVLWLKELSLLFGSTAYAASTTLAVFFLGLAVGSAVFGRWSPRLRSPLRAYAWIELGIAASAALYFVLLEVYFQLYGPIYDALADRPAAFNAFRVALATLVLLPPAALMGGTLPVLGQHLVRRPGELGRHGALLYAVNTIGAATGAFLAGFVLPLALGFDRAYLLAMAVNVAVAGLAWRLSQVDAHGAARAPDVPADRQGHLSQVDAHGAARAPDARADRQGHRGRRSGGSRRRPPAAAPAGAAVSAWLLAAVAGLSGVFALGLEVLWTRMFAQVLQNSVYTFSTVLVVFLAALATGSAVANRLCRLRAAPARVLWMLLTLSGLGVAATPLRLSPPDGRAQHPRHGRRLAPLRRLDLRQHGTAAVRAHCAAGGRLPLPAARLGRVAGRAGRRHRTPRRPQHGGRRRRRPSRPGSCCSGRSGSGTACGSSPPATSSWPWRPPGAAGRRPAHGSCRRRPPSAPSPCSAPRSTPRG